MARLLFAALIALGLMGGAFAPGMAYAQVGGPGPEFQPVDGQCPDGMVQLLEPREFPQTFAILSPGCYRVVQIYVPAPPEVIYVPVDRSALADGNLVILPSDGIGYTSGYTAPGYTSGYTAAATGCCSASTSDVAVRGYYRSDGTYVQPHMRSAPDNTRSNNFSSRGNTNPYTGARGTRP
jgi:hypothetical protein